jgi:hypothetical protein
MSQDIAPPVPDQTGKWSYYEIVAGADNYIVHSLRDDNGNELRRFIKQGLGAWHEVALPVMVTSLNRAARRRK